MSAYYKNPEWACGWPDFVPPPGDPRWKLLKWALVTAWWIGVLFVICH